MDVNASAIFGAMPVGIRSSRRSNDLRRSLAEATGGSGVISQDQTRALMGTRKADLTSRRDESKAATAGGEIWPNLVGWVMWIKGSKSTDAEPCTKPMQNSRLCERLCC